MTYFIPYKECEDMFIGHTVHFERKPKKETKTKIKKQANRSLLYGEEKTVKRSRRS